MNCQALEAWDSPHFPGRPERVLTKVTDADNHATAFNYDINARLTAVTNALSQSKNFSYDTENNLTAVTDPDGHNISFSYDALNRLTTKTLPEGAVNYSYDAVGNLISVQSYNGSSIQTTYDAMNRPSQIIEKLPSGFSATISYTYDLDGNKTSMTTPWGTFSYAYDADNRETSVTNPQGEKFAFTYDADGHRVGLAYPNGISTSYGYDAASQLTQVLHQKNGTAIAFANYNYDADGNRISMQTTNGANSYSYDALNRLLSASHPAASLLPTQNETFSYDPVGNREADATITGYQYNAANELVSNSSFTYSYDANGNLISKTPVGGSATTYSYDSQNELLSVLSGLSVLSVARYDALGRRIFRSTGTLPSQTIQYVYDGQDILAMLDGSGNLIALFTHGPGIDEPLEIRQASGAEYFLHADGLGSIVAATDVNGNVVERIEYESYGQPVFLDERGASPVIESQSLTGSPFAFTGQPFDSETGLYDYRTRYYDPIIGRHPINDKFTGFNLLPITQNEYVYVMDNPVNMIDPFGIWGIGIIGGATGTAGTVYGGAGTISVGGGIFGPNSLNFLQNLNLGGFFTQGGFTRGQGGTGCNSFPSINNWWNSSIGAYAGGGIGFFGTNASNVTLLSGPFKTISIDLGNGLEGISVQIAWSGTTVIISASPFGYGWGGAVTTLPTTTVTTGLHPL
jgi:RHS repeat-associated protein